MSFFFGPKKWSSDHTILESPGGPQTAVNSAMRKAVRVSAYVIPDSLQSWAGSGKTEAAEAVMLSGHCSGLVMKRTAALSSLRFPLRVCLGFFLPSLPVTL